MLILAIIVGVSSCNEEPKVDNEPPKTEGLATPTYLFTFRVTTPIEYYHIDILKYPDFLKNSKILHDVRQTGEEKEYAYTEEYRTEMTYNSYLYRITFAPTRNNNISFGPLRRHGDNSFKIQWANGDVTHFKYKITWSDEYQYFKATDCQIDGQPVTIMPVSAKPNREIPFTVFEVPVKLTNEIE